MDTRPRVARSVVLTCTATRSRHYGIGVVDEPRFARPEYGVAPDVPSWHVTTRPPKASFSTSFVDYFDAVELSEGSSVGTSVLHELRRSRSVRVAASVMSRNMRMSEANRGRRKPRTERERRETTEAYERRERRSAKRAA